MQSIAFDAKRKPQATIQFTKIFFAHSKSQNVFFSILLSKGEL